MWLFENNNLYDDFQSMSCKRGNIWITKSEIFHKSTVHVNNKIQRTVLFWFVSIKKNHEILNNIESKTWDKFSVCHIAQIVLFFTPSGFFNWFEAISYKFSFFIHLSLNNSLSKALTNQLNWNNSTIHMIINVLLKKNKKTAKNVIKKHWLKMLKLFQNAWNIVINAEKKMYVHENFF